MNFIRSVLAKPEVKSDFVLSLNLSIRPAIILPNRQTLLDHSLHFLKRVVQICADE
jgi:hypothetical protein